MNWGQCLPNPWLLQWTCRNGQSSDACYAEGQNTAAPYMSYYICSKTWLMDNKDDKDKIGMLITFPTRGTGDSGQPPCSGRGRAMWPRYDSSSCLSNAVCLDLCGQGLLQPHCRVLQYSQWRLVHEELLVVPLRRQEWSRNNLCHHPGDLTFTVSAARDTTDRLPFFEVLSSLTRKVQRHPISVICNHSNHPMGLFSACARLPNLFLFNS